MRNPFAGKKSLDQGKAIVEQDGEVYVIYYPNGFVEGAADRNTVVRKLRAFWAKRLGNADYGVGLIEWNLTETK